MDTLSSINLNLNPNIRITTYKRNSPWFGRFFYNVNFTIPEAAALRGLSHPEIDKVIRLRREWGRGSTNYGGSWRHWNPGLITDKNVNDLHELCDFFQNDDADRKITLSSDSVYVYTSDTALLARLMDLDVLKNVPMFVGQVEIVGAPGTIQLKKSDHTLRSYFRPMRTTLESGISIRKFLQAQQDIRLSPGLKNWVNRPSWSWIQDHYFIDHNNTATISMLALIAPRLVRRTLPIVADK